MAIPTMAIGCSMTQASAGPGLVESLKDVSNAIEALTITPPQNPTHLGLGVRFDLSHTGGTMEEPGATLDVGCRIDLLSIELGSSGAQSPRPMPAVHINANLGRESYDQAEAYLHGGPGKETRLRSVDLDVSWSRDNITGGNNWDASLSLNDASFGGYVDWTKPVPGCLKIGLNDWDAGALEALDVLLGGYSLSEHHQAIDTFLSGLHILGLAYNVPVDNPSPGEQDIRWFIDQPALTTFIDSTRDYLEGLLQDPHGNWDLGQPLPSTGLPIGQHIASFIPHATWNTGTSITSGGQLDIHLPIDIPSSGVHISLDRYGELAVALEPLSVGPADISAMVSMDAFDPSTWADGPSIEILLTMGENLTGLFEGATLSMTKNSPWALNLELSGPMRAVIFDNSNSSGMDFVTIGPSFDLLNTTERNVILSAIPGMVLDAALQTLLDKLLLQRLDTGSDLGTIFTVLGAASTDSQNVLCANSLIPWFDDPLGHLSSKLLTSNGLNIPAMLTLFEAFLGLVNIELDHTSIEVLPLDAVEGQTPDIVVTQLHAHIRFGGEPLFMVSLMENPNRPGTFSILIETHPTLGSLGGSMFSVQGALLINIANDLTVDLEGSNASIEINTGNAISGAISPGDGSEKDSFMTEILGALSTSSITFKFELMGGIPTVWAEVDFDVFDANVPVCVMNLYPTVSGIDKFLREIAGSIVKAVLPELITYGINQLTMTIGDTTVAEFIKGVLIDLEVWSSGAIDLVEFEKLCNNPMDHLKTGTRMTALILRVGGLLLQLIPQGSGTPPITITPNSNGNKSWFNIKLNTTNTWLAGLSLDIGDKLADGEYGLWLGYEHTISPIRDAELPLNGGGSGYIDGTYHDVVVTGDDSGANSARALVVVEDGEVSGFVIQHSGNGYQNEVCTLSGGSNQNTPAIEIDSTPPTSDAQLTITVMRFNIDAEIGFSRNLTDEWNLSIAIGGHFMDRLMDTPFLIQPAIRMDLIDGQFGLVMSSGVDTGTSNTNNSPVKCTTDCFWLRLFPIDDFRTQLPDLGAMLVGAANTALDFLEGVQEVQEFLRTPLYTDSSGGLDAWQVSLEGLTIIGDWLVHLGICSYESPAIGIPAPGQNSLAWKGTRPGTLLPSGQGVPFNIRSMNDIIGHYTKSISNEYPYPSNANNVFDVLLRGILDMILSIATTSIPVYSRVETEFDFTISLDIKTNPNIIGINFDFDDELLLSLGLLDLAIFTRDEVQDQDYSRWDSKAQPYSKGITLQLLKIDTQPGASQPIEDHFSLEIGHLGFELRRKDKSPLLDSFLLLDSVCITTCIDMEFVGGIFTVEAGGRLDLEEFGISLGGDGSSDGGNGLAAGVLADDGSEGGTVRPTFDISIWKYHTESVEVMMRGELEYWFPVNKQFGPVKIAQIGVRIDNNQTFNGQSEPRLAILIDGEAKIAGFLAQLDDLEVSFPILALTDVKGQRSNGWQYDLAGCAIAYDGPAFEIAGALRKTVLSDTDGNSYLEYQGLCTISTSTMAISAIGAFGRVPNSQGDSYVTCFVIAALDFPIGGPPMFFVTGLAGGLGLNRQLVLPEVSDVPNSPFIRALNGFGDNPMGALESIREALPAKQGSLWFAVGVKFKSFQVIDTKAVLFVKISDGFTIGILGTSTLHLPSEALSIGYVELAFLAYYDSAENLLWVQAQLTDASYLFDKNCRLTGGFALASWFSRGEFVLSVGGYHPKFKAPSYYPEVPRLGINWKPMSNLTIKGGAYFTVCTSAVMLGGGLEATFKSGALSAAFRAGVDVLVVFDPFYYSFGIYIGVSVRLKTWLGTLKASLGADLQIEGPKMRGTAKIDVAFISFTVKFGSNSATDFKAIDFDEFVNKHVLQLSENLESLASEFSSECFSAQIPEGLVRGDDGNERLGSQQDPWVVVPEFELFNSHIFPASSHTVKSGTETISSAWRIDSVNVTDPIKLAPCGIDNGIISDVTLEIIPLGGISSVNNIEGISAVNKATHFPETVWRCEMKNGRPVALKKPSSQQPKFLTGMSLLFRACSLPRNWTNTTSMDQVKESTFIHNLPLRKGTQSNPVFEEGPKFSTNLEIENIRIQRTQPASLQDVLTIAGNTELMEINQQEIRSRAGSRSAQIEHDIVERKRIDRGGVMR